MKIPESPEWLLSNGREKKGRKLVERFAEKNGKILTEEDWKDAEIKVNISTTRCRVNIFF